MQFAVGGVVLALWAFAYAKAIIDPKFHPPEGLSGVALLVVGWLYTTGLRSTRDVREWEQEDEEDA